jgi:c-di-AMP phosphodiesterase-like protein
VDAIGASIGIYATARIYSKKAHIVLNDVTTSLQPIVDLYKGNPDYEKDLFVTSEEALSKVGNNTLLVVVDVNRANYTECPELVGKCKNTVVFDHHRQGNDQIENATLSYIEPYASSTCEMVSEILQYISDNVKIKPIEADTLYAGIVIDTNNFSNKAGARTFEAAAFMRRCGADIVRVRKLLRSDMTEYKAKADAVRHADVYKSYALSVCPSEGLQSPTIVGAQAANELLNINGIKASIVFTEYNDTIYLSARSIDEVNVQIIMERLGGGGHMTIAGAQLKDMTMDEAVSLVKKTLDDMEAEGAI